MKSKHIKSISVAIFLLLALSALSACSDQEMGSITGVNHTGEGIQSFSIDNAGGSSVGRYGISGVVCCAAYPSKWSPELRVTVEWERSDCEGRWNLCTVESARQDRWPHKTFKKNIPMEKYTDSGSIYVVFLPHDDVRIYITNYYPESKNFPSKLGFPKDPGDDKTYIEMKKNRKDEPRQR